MRELAAIDKDIWVESELLKRDVRQGENCLDAMATRDRLNVLLDERLEAMTWSTPEAQSGIPSTPNGSCATGLTDPAQPKSAGA
jgi:hypothetical protein